MTDHFLTDHFSLSNRLPEMIDSKVSNSPEGLWVLMEKNESVTSSLYILPIILKGPTSSKFISAFDSTECISYQIGSFVVLDKRNTFYWNSKRESNKHLDLKTQPSIKAQIHSLVFHSYWWKIRFHTCLSSLRQWLYVFFKKFTVKNIIKFWEISS